MCSAAWSRVERGVVGGGMGDCSVMVSPFPGP